MFGSTMRCPKCNKYLPDRCTCPPPSQPSFMKLIEGIKPGEIMVIGARSTGKTMFTFRLAQEFEAARQRSLEAATPPEPGLDTKGIETQTESKP